MDSFDETKLNNYECPNCHGGGLGKQQHLIQLWEVCKRCGGTGSVDWVSNVVASHSAQIGQAAGHNAVMSNIQILKSRIYEEGIKMGIHITVDLRFKDVHEHYMQTHPQLIVKGGKLNVSY